MMVPRGTTPSLFDVVVVGAGHAGCEAALATARLGLATALVTIRIDRVAVMSCNPAIGGIGKSHIVREIDALGGEMGRAADCAAIHFRRLNASKGPAVRARRVQCDLGVYHRSMLSVLQSYANLSLIESIVQRLFLERQGVFGIELDCGTLLRAKTVVLTTGTFLRGLIHIGEESFQGGRLGDPPSMGISKSLEAWRLRLGRLKTGTPARLRADTVDLERLEIQASDEAYLPFSHEGVPSDLPRIQCAMTRTNSNTHAVIRAGLSRSPLFKGVIQGRGPRYCPSIEDKVIRFPDRTSHQVILEPTDLTRTVLYPNGISTSLPRDVQEEMIHSIEGLEAAEIADFGYAIEYDFVLPTQLRATLEVRSVPGLFLAGQINGTSGYEEAAGQGLMAGINAAFRIMDRPPVVLARHEAYIGVMIDDLVTRGTNEPYRMFSSRAEFRLLLREDNPSCRLAHWSERIGLVPGEVLKARRASSMRVEQLIQELRQRRLPKDREGRRPTLEKVLRRPEMHIDRLMGELNSTYSQDEMEQAEVRIKYQGYVERQRKEAVRLAQWNARRIPEDMAYERIPGLSKELAEKLAQIRPNSFAQASRVDGMTPAALKVLSIWLKKLEGVPRGTQPG